MRRRRERPSGGLLRRLLAAFGGSCLGAVAGFLVAAKLGTMGQDPGPLILFGGLTAVFHGLIGAVIGAFLGIFAGLVVEAGWSRA